MTDLVGTTLGDRYKLIARLAGGGMGDVYKAHDLLLDRAVAVKVLQPALAADELLVDRFKAEARAAARLSHPNVVAVHDWGSEGDSTYYMVMEYVAGSDLRDVLVTRGCLQPLQAAEVVASLCDALAAAHACGLVHRDVKPENVLIARGGEVKVADFGIAAVADLERTMPGGLVPGTLRYLSPEQADGHAATPASDIWASGAVLSELVTGQPPQQGSGVEFLRRRASEAPLPPSSVDPRVPREIDEIVLRACAVEPRDRFRSASEMAHSLRRVAVRSLPDAPSLHSLVDDITGVIDLRDPVPTRLERRRNRGWRRRLKLTAAACAVLLITAGAAAAGAELLLAEPVSVPDVVGRSRASAARVLEAAGLELEIGARERHFGARAGEVVAQEPADGRLPEGSSVRVTLSAGLPLQRVPPVVGRPVDEVIDKLELSGFEVARVDESYSAKPQGTVISQRPSEGEAPWGSAIWLVASKGPEPVAIPALDGSKAKDARARLRRAGFEVSVERDYSDHVPAGKVISTMPAAGEVVPGGSEIELSVSIGPRFAELEMPDVRNSSVERARSRLVSLGLRVEVVPSCAGSTVVETDPIPGTIVRENDLVALFVC